MVSLLQSHTPTLLRARDILGLAAAPGDSVAPGQIGLNRRARRHVSAPGLQPQHDRGRRDGEKRVKVSQQPISTVHLIKVNVHLFLGEYGR